MAKVADQILDWLKKHRNSFIIRDPQHCIELLDEAEHLLRTAERCLINPSNASMSTCIFLLRLRESLQSTSLLLSCGLFEDALTIARKWLEISISLFYVLATGKIRTLTSSSVETSKPNFKVLCNNLPLNYGSAVYDLYRQLCKYTHMSGTVAISTMSELANWKDVEKDENEFDLTQWPRIIREMAEPLMTDVVISLANLYIYDVRGDLDELRNKVYQRLLWRIALENPDFYRGVFESVQLNSSSLRDQYLPLLIERGVLNRNNSPGPVLLAEMQQDLEEAISVLDSSKLAEIQEITSRWTETIDE